MDQSTIKSMVFIVLSIMLGAGHGICADMAMISSVELPAMAHNAGDDSHNDTGGSESHLAGPQ